MRNSCFVLSIGARRIPKTLLWLVLLNIIVALPSSLLSVVAFTPFNGVKVSKVTTTTTSTNPTDGIVVDIGEWIKLSSSSSSDNNGSNNKCMIVFGTYAADFNAIEYGQRLRYYWSKLQHEKGITRCALLLNCQPAAAIAFQKYIDLPDSIELWVDNTGNAARVFGVERGWLPDNEDINPFIKLFGMLWGFGAWATLPAVIGGYIGNPFVPQPWIEDALLVGAKQGRWPDNALELNDDKNVVVKNKFDDLPIVGTWPRRPLELATLRLQSMLGISLAHWDELAPDQDALDAGVLTQLGGCLIIDSTNNNVLYEWKDPGICAVANFEDIMKKI